MATFKLYPPTVAGTTPPFYKTDTGTYILRVPFTMNKMVNMSDVGGVKLRIRAADTDLEIGRLNAYNYALSSDEGSYADFDLAPIVASIFEGKYYKIQLAYIDAANDADIGYYSTISITKCTAYPVISIVGLDQYSSNVDTGYYTGLYTNIDSSEKCYQYKFTLYDSAGEVLDTSGWLLHNTNSDDKSTESNDSYFLNYSCEPSEKYSLQYSVITTNALQLDGPKYLLVGSTSVAPELKADLVADLDYDNGCVNLSLNPWVQSKQQQALTVYTGQFVVSRSSSKEDFRRWTKIVTFQLSGTLPQGTMFTDFTIEQGQTYRYALQQFNDNKIYSSRVCAPDVYAAFEDAYLYDGERQLRIRFNPKVSSFKTVLQDSKKNTLGSKYPFFFRNGIVSYKEFPISGLISYMIDENQYFMSRQEELGMDIDWQDTTDIIDENIAFERKFKLKVLDWLNDGCIKLFRSPGEGNYLVRLTQVQLTPEDSLSRMIHTFQCTADEIEDFTPQKLITYGFLKVADSEPLELRFGTIRFDEMIETIISTSLGRTDEVPNAPAATLKNALRLFANTDLLNGKDCQYLKFEDCDPGTWFSIGGKNKYVIGQTGQYEHHFDDLVSVLKIIDPWRHMPGSVTYGVWTTQTSSFDTVSQISQRDVIANPIYTGTNYIDQVTTTKDKIQRIYGMHFTLNDLVYEMSSLEDFCTTYNLYLQTGSPTAYNVLFGLSEQEYQTARAKVESDPLLTPEKRADLLAELQSIRQMTQQWNNQISHKINTTIVIRGDARIANNEGRTYSDLFTDNSIFIDLSDGKTYRFDRNMYTFTEIQSEIPVEIIKYNSSNRTWETTIYQLSPTQVCIDDEIVDLAETGYLDVPATDAVPTQLYWGSKVSCTLIYQLLTITYGVESQVIPGLGQSESLVNAWNAYSNAAKLAAANKLHYCRINGGTNARRLVNAVPNSDYEECSYYVWNTVTLHFDRLSREARKFFQGSEVWIPWPYSTTDWRPTGNISDGHTIVPYLPTKIWSGYGDPDVEQAKKTFYDLLDAELVIQEKKLVLSNE